MSGSATLESSGLVRAVVAKGLRGSSLQFPSEPLEPADWSKLRVSVWFQRLDGFLAAAVHDYGLPVTPQQWDEVLTAHADAMKVCLALEGDLLEIAGVLDQHGIGHRVLKGPAFAHLDYLNPALRVFGDIDLLVRSEDFDTAAAALATAGFERKFSEVRAGFDRRFGKGASFKGPNGRELDLHRTFVMGPYGLMLDLHEVWNASDVFEIAGRTFDTLDVELRFLHACYHAALGNVRPRLAPLRDLAGMLQRSVNPVDIDRALSLSRRWQATAVVSRAVSLAWEAFALPDDSLAAWARNVPLSSRDRRSLRTYLDPDMGYAARSYAALKAVRGARAKAAFAWALAVPDRNYGAGRHGSHWGRLKQAARQIVALRKSDSPQ